MTDYRPAPRCRDCIFYETHLSVPIAWYGRCRGIHGWAQPDPTAADVLRTNGIMIDHDSDSAPAIYVNPDFYCARFRRTT